MEIERKFLIGEQPTDLFRFSHSHIEQGYLNTDPVVRIRKEEQTYTLTYKGEGMMAREEYNLPLNAQAYAHLREKTDGLLIRKTRYRIPIGDELTAELDVFEGEHAGLVIVEVEFPDENTAAHFTPPDWFGEDVTYDAKYHNSWLSQI